MKKNLYWDIKTEAKVQKIKKTLKNKVSESRIVRKAVFMTPFDKLVEELNREIESSK